jgi:hypothetical protein
VRGHVNIEAMEARLVDAIPIGEEWQYEPKWDGFRCLLTRDADAVTMYSKSGQDLRRYFPEVVAAALTTGLLRADNKLPKLVARHSTVRARLDQSNNRHVKLLPIMVSTLTKAELQADLEQAEKLGVGVLSREDLDQLVNRTTLTGNAAEWFNFAEKTIEGLKSKSKVNEPELPLN